LLFPNPLSKFQEHPMAKERSGTPAEDPAQIDGANAWTTRRKTVVGLIAGITVVAILGAVIIVATARHSNSATSSGASTPSASSTDSSSPAPSASGTSSVSPSAGPSDSPTPAPIADPGTVKPGLTAQITKFEAVNGVAKTPGETSGPSVRFTVTMTNSGSSAESLATTVVTAYYGNDNTPALQLSEPGGVDMPASVPGGGTAAGVYIFTIPIDQRKNVLLKVDYSIKVAPLVFQGALPL
jgi:hypothetical protein